ncbi:MAG: hypothetical protein BKPUNTRY_002256 [Candidatus Fervidibacter sp.]
MGKIEAGKFKGKVMTDARRLGDWVGVALADDKCADEALSHRCRPDDQFPRFLPDD